MPRGVPFDQEQLGQIKVGRALGKTNAAIARDLGVTKEGVRKAAVRHSREIAELQATKNKELADLYESKARATAEAITPEKIDKAGLRDLAITSGVMLDKSRLLRGESQINVSVTPLATKAELESEIAACLRWYAERGLEPPTVPDAEYEVIDTEKEKMLELDDE